LLGQFRRDLPLAQVSQDPHLSQALVLEAGGSIVFGETAVIQVSGLLQFCHDGVHILVVLRAAAKFFPQLARRMRAATEGAQCNV
jgi:hypothetical protein